MESQKKKALLSQGLLQHPVLCCSHLTLSHKHHQLVGPPCRRACQENVMIIPRGISNFTVLKHFHLGAQRTPK